jgi:hypothetical protein
MICPQPKVGWSSHRFLEHQANPFAIRHNEDVARSELSLVACWMLLAE